MNKSTNLSVPMIKPLNLSNFLEDLKSLNQRLSGLHRTADSISTQLAGEHPCAMTIEKSNVSTCLLSAVNEQICDAFKAVSEIENRMADVCDAIGYSYSPDRVEPGSADDY